jgi:hypothetical protein
LAGLSEDVPRVVALIDLFDLRWQMERIGRAFRQDLTPFVQRLEAGLAALLPAGTQTRLPVGAVYVYSRREADRPREVDRMVFKTRGTGLGRECSACYRQCTHCKEGAGSPAGQGRDNPIAGDLLALARKEEYEWAVVVSTDLLLIPVVRYVQSHGRKIVHGCFPPIARDLTRECWASIDLSGR